MCQSKSLKRLQIAYCCDDDIFDGLFLSILSIIKRTKNPIDFYLFTANLTEIKKSYIALSKEHELIINNLVKQYNPNNTFTIIDCKQEFLKRLNGETINSKHWTPYASFRLLLDMFAQIKGTILYLDTDTLVCDDIISAFEVDIQNYELCVTQDIISRLNKDKYFNSGVLLINIEMVRKTGLFTKAFDYLVKEKPDMCDQDSLNATASLVKWRSDDRFNRIYKFREENTVIKHFAGWKNPKPWKKKFIRKSQKLNYSIWNNDIQEWKEMKSKL